MVPVVILGAVLYAGLLGIASGLWLYHKKNSILPVGNIKGNRFSVLVPFRNEASHLEQLVACLRQQTLPPDQWECIFINDHSEDQGEVLIGHSFNFNSKIISSPGEGKKAALLSGCAEAKGEYIIQTDADCMPLATWLSSIDPAMGQLPDVILTGPVAIREPKTILDHFQSMDMLALMGMTFAGIKTGWWHMGNGANLAYPKSLRSDEDLLSTGDQYASGDDMFLIESALASKKYILQFNFNPAGIVYTGAVPGLFSFLQQRLRWGAKNAAMNSIGLKTALTISLGFNILLVFLTIASLFDHERIFVTSILWLQKWIIDYLYLMSIAPFFNTRIKTIPYVVCALLYPFYSVVISLLTIFNRNYEWKGRLVR